MKDGKWEIRNGESKLKSQTREFAVPSFATNVSPGFVSSFLLHPSSLLDHAPAGGLNKLDERSYFC
jgi:hypothetical protein